MLAVLIAFLVAVPASCMYLLQPESPKPDNFAAPSGNFHFTFGVSDLYAPFLTPEENAAVLNSLTVEDKIYATYRHTTYAYSLFACDVGVGCWPAPHWVEQSTEEKRDFPVTMGPGKSSDGVRTLSVDIPQSLDGGYSLAEFAFMMSPDTFYRQPGYQALVKKSVTELSPLDRDPAPPMFDYLVDFTDHDLGPDQDDIQDCLFIMMPLKSPTISIPIVTRVGTNSKRMSLRRLSGNEPCPMTDIDVSSTPDAAPGRLPLARIAAAQVNIDFDAVDKATRLAGTLPVTNSMTRWFQRNNDGVEAYLTEFGSFKKMEMHIRGDTAHLINGTFPAVRIETWTFFEDSLVGYTGSIFYDTQQEKVDDEPAIHWEEYFHDGRPVWTKTEPTHCDDLGCREALAEIRIEISKPYDALRAEAQSYMQLSSALKPTKRD
ncbi:hypothetical protein N0A02_27480 [Paraburkholderia acidicola]|uniref:Tle cognate immunity protein 4 C-terminal domain-containing protein n=1 Tax=Paraburkholderia acidicola TaxID=1912599 RepID=A0ABV1LV54_9BURK